MEYCTAAEVYVTDFLARNFAICDHWFAPLPASTLPNRLMAMCGYALTDHTPDGVIQEIKNTELFLEHRPDPILRLAGVKGTELAHILCRHAFFRQVSSMFVRYESGSGQFRELDQLKVDALNDDLPDVAFVEPFYWCDPRKEGTAASDDHAPASLAGGQRFLNVVRDAVIGPESRSREIRICGTDC